MKKTIPNRVLLLDGDGDYVEMADRESLNSINLQVTLEAWIKPTAFTNEWIPIIYKGDKFIDGSYRHRSYSLYINSSKRAIHLSSARAVMYWKFIESPPGIINLNQWYHIAGILDWKNQIMRIFINGLELASSANFSGSISTSKLPLLIGWTHEGEPQYSHFAGEIDEVRIWSIARSQEDIQRTMNTSLSGKEQGLVGYWNFDKDTGKVVDLSWSHADGKLIGNAHITEAEFPKAEPSDFAVVSGIVKDAARQLVPWANVRLELNNDVIKWETTDNSGKYYMIVRNPVNEPYDLFAITGKLGGLISNVHLHEGEGKIIDFTIKESVSIEGNTLMMDDNTPHTYMSVQLIRDGKVVDSVLSDEKGIYRFIYVKPRDYQVRCQVLGGYIYYNDGKVLAIEEGKTLNNIDLQFPSFIKGTWRCYDPSDGLANLRTHAIHQSSDGALWFGSGSFNNNKGSGVTRYDGKTFTIFAAKDGLAHNNVWAICSEPDGTMWFGTWGGGASRYRDGKFTNFTEKDGLASNDVLAIHRSRDGNIWFGTSKGVSRYDGRDIGDCPHFTNFTFKDGLINNTVWVIESDSDGRLWFGTSSGISVYDGKKFETINEDELCGYMVCAIHRDSDGVMWFGTGSTLTINIGIGVFRYDGREFTRFTTRDGLMSNSVMSIKSTPDGVMWFGTTFGVSSFDGKTFINFLPGKLSTIDAVCVNQDGSLWFGTGYTGVAQYDYKAFAIINTADGSPGNYTQSSYRDHTGRLWVGSGNGVALYDNCDHWRAPVTFTQKDGLGYSSYISVIHEDCNGKLWFGTGGFMTTASGIYCYDRSTNHLTNFNTKDGLANNIVWSMCSGPDGRIWIGTRGGLSIYDGKSFINPTKWDGLDVNATVFSICRSSVNMMWLGTGAGIFSHDGTGFTKFTEKDGLKIDYALAIGADSKGVVWFGTQSDGISRYDGKDFTSFEQDEGVGNKDIFSIYCASDGIVWFGTYGGGVYGYDGQAWTSLNTDNGLSDNKVFSIDPDPDGSLWISTAGGLTHYRRGKIPPKVNIVSVTTDKTYTGLSRIPPFNPGTRVTVRYNAIDFKTLPDKRQYRCRIPEIDKAWLKPTKSELFDHVFEKSGTYTFEVQAIDRDLNYSEPVSVKLEVISDPRDRRIIHLEAHIREQEIAELERVHKELEDARQIQLSLLPEKPPEIEGFQIAGISNPAREVSGDFYSYLSLGANTGIVLGDITGKSMRAAMVAAMTNGMLHSEIKGREELWNSSSKILGELNVSLKSHLIRSMNTSMSLGIIQPKQKKLIFSNAGMPYPVVKRGHKAWELVVNGLPLGITNIAEYEDLSLELEEGDFVVFCSDGVIEAENPEGEMYQSERLLEVIGQADPNLPAQGMVNLILGDVVSYVGDEEASDDITIVVIRCGHLSF